LRSKLYHPKTVNSKGNITASALIVSSVLYVLFPPLFMVGLCYLQKPFPDKSFYVFDGKPLCAYHYHEANESLCAAARCGQPIEGPCAVSHTGDRYHPEHMTCEYPGHTPCLVTLEEYWEVDGRMLCERHAKASNDDDSGSEEWVQSSKAKRRVTRFIDLAGGLSESDGSDLR
jgi:hypothetical protein